MMLEPRSARASPYQTDFSQAWVELEAMISLIDKCNLTKESIMNISMAALFRSRLFFS